MINGTSLKIQELALECKVEDAMTRNIVTVDPEDSMMDVWKKLKGKEISGLPVVCNDNLKGIISVQNFVKCIMKGNNNDLVKNNMTSEVEFIYSDEPLIHVIRKFEKLKFGRFPVKERESEKLTGIITKGDVIQCLLKRFEKTYFEEESVKNKLDNLFEDIIADKTTVTLVYNITAKEFKKAGERSGQLKNALLRLGISTDVTRRVVIACLETEMNIIIFTNGGIITAQIEEDKIKVNAVDDGPGIPDIEMAMRPGFSTAPDWVREMGFGAGMGLPNIKNCTDDMKINSVVGKGTNLEFMVKIENDTFENCK